MDINLTHIKHPYIYIFGPQFAKIYDYLQLLYHRKFLSMQLIAISLEYVDLV